MSTVASLVAEVKVVGASEAKEQLKGVSGSVKETSTGFKGMLSGALSFAAGQAVFNAVGQAAGFLKDQIGSVFQVTMAHQAVMAQLNSRLADTHDAVGLTSSVIQQYAEKLSDLTPFTQDAIEAGDNMLLTFTSIGKNVFPQASHSMVELAQVMGGDMQGAAVMLGKSMDDPVAGISALHRVGVSFTDSQKEMIKQMVAAGNTAGAQTEILKILSSQGFGTAAEAAGKTLAGQLQILHNQFDNVKDKIGTAVVPILQQFTGFVKSNVMPAINNFSDWITNTGVPALKNLTGFITGTVVPDVQNLASWFTNFTGVTNNLTPVLVGLAATLTIALIPAVLALVTSLSPFILIAIGVGIAIAGLVAIFEHFYNTNAGFKSFIDGVVKGLQQAASFVQANFLPAMKQIGDWISTYVMPVLQQLGSFIASQFQPTWKQLVDMWNSQLLPLFKQLWGAIQQMMPLFQLLGMIIGGLVVTAIGVLIGLIAGLAKGISYFVEGLANVVAGIVRVFTGISQVIGGIVQFIVDLIHGKFDKLGGDLGQIGTGLLNMFIGLWQAVIGVFQAAWGLVSGIVVGFVQGIIGFFQGLFDKLVGHSIIPDMITGIFNWFGKLPGLLGGAIANAVSTVLGKFASLLSSGLSWAGNFVSGLFNALGQLAGQAGNAMQTAVNTILSTLGNAISSAASAGLNIVVAIANGIISGIGSAIGGAMNQVGSFIQSHLPHSPAKMGPLIGLDQSGANIPTEIAKGMVRGMPAIQSSLNLMLTPTLNTASSGTHGPWMPQGTQVIPSSQSFGSGAQQPITNVYVSLDGYQVAGRLMPHIASHIRYGVGAKF
jgi:phage-related protein